MHSRDTTLLHELPLQIAERWPEHVALTYSGRSITYGEMATLLRKFASGLRCTGLERGERVAVYLEKRLETVIAAFGATAAGGIFVPINPVLKPDQVSHILRDCGVSTLITSTQRMHRLGETLADCPDLREVIVAGACGALPCGMHFLVRDWSAICEASPRHGHRVIDADVAAIFYTSGSTGRPKGVVLSHRNMVAGAKSVASYLENDAEDVLIAALPLSFDAGFSQLTTAFHSGCRVVLLNYLLPQDLLNALARERVTGITAVPPLYMQIAQLEWPPTIAEHLRYFANTGGKLPLETLSRLRDKLPRSKPFLMYGLTEAFRATYLAPNEIDRRPDSIGKAIPNAEILVLREDGARCAPNEPGELVQRGALVSLGYWNNTEATAERFRPLPRGVTVNAGAVVSPETAVFSGDTVCQDEEGFLYFIGRRDEMIKTSGYRVSPTEVEDALYGTGLLAEAAAFGVAHPTLGQAIVAVATPRAGRTLDAHFLIAACRERLPLYMVPAKIDIRGVPLPRNPNGKIDRRSLAEEFEGLFDEPAHEVGSGTATGKSRKS